MAIVPLVKGWRAYTGPMREPQPPNFRIDLRHEVGRCEPSVGPNLAQEVPSFPMLPPATTASSLHKP
jgi:hypothetical protein